jgi:hypothetical protein
LSKTEFKLLKNTDMKRFNPCFEKTFQQKRQTQISL